MSEIEERLAAHGITLPTPAAPAGSYVPVVRMGALLFVSGQLPFGPDGLEYVGRCGAEYGVEEGQKAARLCAVNILAQLKAELGDLSKLKRLGKVTGFVNSTPDFTDQPKVLNGASDLFAAILGERGVHARAAVGVAVLPLGVAVEVEAIAEAG